MINVQECFAYILLWEIYGIMCYIYNFLGRLEFIFVYGSRESSNFIDLHVPIEFSKHHFAEEIVFSPLYILSASVED